MYSRESVIAATRNGGGMSEGFANSLGQAEGGGTPSVHKAAIQFWQVALSLEGDDALNAAQVAFAQAEIAKHQRALEPPQQVNRFGPPPDFKGQPI